MDNRVKLDGIDLTYLNLVIEEIFFRQMRHQEFDASELSFSSFLVSMFDETPPFIAIPIFPSRSFRHSGIYINANAGIREPRDLAGKRVGCAEYQLTANVWIRGILKDEYGVEPSSFTTVIGGLEEAGRVEKAAVSLPPDISRSNTSDLTRRSPPCWTRARSTRCLLLARRQASSGEPAGSAACSKIPMPPSGRTTSGRRFFRSCMSWSFDAISTGGIAGWRNRSTRDLSRRSAWQMRICIRRPRSKSCCRG